MDYEKILKEAVFDVTNVLYNNIMMDIFGIDSKEDEAGFEFIYALNRHGVPSRVIFEALQEVAKGHMRDE